jgi:hypothetical protein
MIWYFCAVSAGMSLTIAESISNCERLIDGTPYLLRQQGRDLFVLDEAQLDEVVPELSAARLLIVERLLQLGRSDALLFEQQLAYADGHRLLVRKKLRWGERE